MGFMRLNGLGADAGQGMWYVPPTSSQTRPLTNQGGQGMWDTRSSQPVVRTNVSSGISTTTHADGTVEVRDYNGNLIGLQPSTKKDDSSIASTIGNVFSTILTAPFKVAGDVLGATAQVASSALTAAAPAAAITAPVLASVMANQQQRALERNGPPQQPASSSSFPVIPVVLIGGVTILGAVYFLTRKPKVRPVQPTAPIANNPRRRRRRRR